MDLDEMIRAPWFREAAEQGDRDAQYALANAYLTGQGVPEDRHVVIGKRRDHCNARCDDIGGVQPPAQAHLDHRSIHFLLGKI